MKERRKLHSFCGLILQLLCHLEWIWKVMVSVVGRISVIVGNIFIYNRLWMQLNDALQICTLGAGGFSDAGVNPLSNP
jgi:hypothetical protein